MSSPPGSSLSADFSEREQQIFHRTRLLVGDQVLHCIGDLRVILFGVGGVGSWCAESLVRSGVRRLTLVDSDRVSITNVNRQMPATVPTVGRVKVEVVRERLLAINPDAEIRAVQDIYCAENAETFALDTYDVIIDAIDSPAEKAHLILRATQTSALFVSSMGAALKRDPSFGRWAAVRWLAPCAINSNGRKRARSASSIVCFPTKCCPISGRTTSPNPSLRWPNAPTAKRDAPTCSITRGTTVKRRSTGRCRTSRRFSVLPSPASSSTRFIAKKAVVPKKNSHQTAQHTINLYLCALNINKKKDNLLRSIWKNSLTPSALSSATTSKV